MCTLIIIIVMPHVYIIGQTLQKLREVDPNDSDAVKEAISGFIQDLLKHTSVNSNSWLRTVDDVINR